MRNPTQFGKHDDDINLNEDPFSERANLAFGNKNFDLNELEKNGDFHSWERAGIKVLVPEPGQSPGEVMVRSDSYQKFVRAGAKGSFSVFIPQHNFTPCVAQQRTTATTSGLTSIMKLPEVAQLGVVPLRVADLLAPGATSAETIRYIAENSFTNAATAVGENGAYPEATWDMTEVDAPVRKIGVLSRVSDEFFADYAAIVSYINMRMAYAAGIREDAELLNGTGISPRIKGLLQTAGIQTQALGANSVPDAIWKAIVKVKTTGWAVPTGIIMHPQDWGNLRITKDNNNQYLYGGPGGFAYGQPVKADPAQGFVWGLPLAETTNIAQGTAAIVSRMDSGQIFRRLGLLIESTNSDASDFSNGRICLRATTRLALAVYRPLSICQVTGIPNI